MVRTKNGRIDKKLWLQSSENCEESGIAHFAKRVFA
jgi:hypothetical protein